VTSRNILKPSPIPSLSVGIGLGDKWGDKIMRKSDIVVIGSGLAGLVAASTAAGQGKKVTLLAQGAGTLTIAGGIIDILGCLGDGSPANNPIAAIPRLAQEHPYRKIGVETVEEAINYFLKICQEEGYPQIGSCNQIQWIPTAAGTLKPTCIVPRTMDISSLEKTTNRIIVGFKYLKDFYPRLIAQNLAAMPGYGGNYEIVTITPPFGGRDLSNLDIARWLETDEGLKEFAVQLSQKVKRGSLLIMPPVLGTSPDYRILNWLKKNLECYLLETVTIPPAITGLRLRSLLINHVKKLGVKVIEQAVVTGSVIENGRCLAVVTESADRQRSYYAKSFILATGGIYGGGLIANSDQVIEPIFNLPVKTPLERDNWTNQTLFSNREQPFAKIGIAVDQRMRPIDETGTTILSNVCIAGRTLAGYDYCFEKSGNGVAVSSGYKAAMSV
jgi:glycerol-3-phosphate dehydrogenase subunit B